MLSILFIRFIIFRRMACSSDEPIEMPKEESEVQDISFQKFVSWYTNSGDNYDSVTPIEPKSSQQNFIKKMIDKICPSIVNS